MKIGLSYSRCIRDIVDGKVDIDDVLVVIARTDFDPHDDKQWAGIWSGYGGGSDGNPLRGLFGGSLPEWAKYTDSDQERVRQVSIDLYDQGKFHQPRQFGAHPRRLPYIWLEAVLPESELDSNVAAKNAWDQFQMLAGLTNIKLQKDSLT